MDNQIFYFFYSFAHQSVWMDNLIIFCAVYLPYIVIMLAGLFLLFHHDVFKADNSMVILRQKYREIFYVFSTGILAFLFSVLLKIIIQTPRPFDVFTNIQPLFVPTDFSFPSGHAMFFSALAFEIFLLHKKAGYVFILLALIICKARIISGVHFPIDILGGFILGLIIAYIIRKFFR